MSGQTGRGAHPRWLGVAAIGVALVLTTGCVGRSKEVHGQHRSFLSSGNGAPAAAPAKTSGNEGTSGLGGGMLQSPDSGAPANTSGNGGTSGLGGATLQSPDNAPAITPTPSK